LVLLGLIALVVFVVTLPSGRLDARALFLGAGLATLGLLLRRRPSPDPEDRPGRFTTVRKILGQRPPDADDT
jgi:hypothetical protein